MTGVLAVLFMTPLNLAVLELPAEMFDIAPDYSTTTLKAYATEVASTSGLNVQRFVNTIECESHFKHDAVGDKGTSLGIAQFRYPERDWGVSSSTVLDPYKAIDLMAQAFLDGKASRWSCWKP